MMLRKEQRRLIKSHMRALKVFKDREENLNYHGSLLYDDEGHKVAIDRVEDVLLDIGIATMHRAKKMSRRVSRRISRRASNTTESLSNSEIICDGRKRHLSTANIIETTHPSTPQSRLQTSSNENLCVKADEHSAIHSRDVTWHHSPSIPELSGSPPSSIASSSVLNQDRSQPDRDALPDEGDYIWVQASDSVPHLDPDLNYEVTEGYINSNIKPTNAFLNSGFPQNVISELYAAELGLAIQYTRRNDKDDTHNGVANEDIESHIKFGAGDLLAVVGRTTFLWRNGQQESHLRPLKITCLVSESIPLQIPLVFGQQYINRRRYYWQR
jgi:hypothetical protein